MLVLILAGGLGTRISEETASRPKPMVEVSGKPMLWHIMSIFARYNYSKFVVATGYKKEVIEEWVANLKTDWEINVLDTGLETQTGGRIEQFMEKYPNQRFIATYGDGVGNVNIKGLTQFHETHERLATCTAVRPPARFGYLGIQGDTVLRFGEKNQADSGWINGGFFVLEPGVYKYLGGNHEPFETFALPKLAKDRELMAFKHEGFWQPMDTQRERQDLENLAKNGNPPWLT